LKKTYESLEWDVNDHPKAKAEVKREKSKDQHEETPLAILKKMEKLSEEVNSRNRLYMNKITTLERPQKSSYISKEKPFPKKQNEEVKPSSSQVPNTLAPTNAVEQDSSSEEEQNDEDESDDEEVDELANLVQINVFNILLGGSYTHLLISGSIECVLSLKFVRKAWAHVFQINQKLFWEIPPRDSFIRIINYF